MKKKKTSKLNSHLYFQVVRIRDTPDGQVDLEHLASELKVDIFHTVFDLLYVYTLQFYIVYFCKYSLKTYQSQTKNTCLEEAGLVFIIIIIFVCIKLPSLALSFTFLLFD